MVRFRGEYSERGIFGEENIQRREDSEMVRFRGEYSEGNIQRGEYWRGEYSERGIFRGGKIQRGEYSERRIFREGKIQRGEDSERGRFREGKIQRGEDSERGRFREGKIQRGGGGGLLNIREERGGGCNLYIMKHPSSILQKRLCSSWYMGVYTVYKRFTQFLCPNQCFVFSS